MNFIKTWSCTFLICATLFIIMGYTSYCYCTWSLPSLIPQTAHQWRAFRILLLFTTVVSGVIAWSVCND